jgi:peptidoglycan/xylan/chitin deacetylase (PgdA/CDA1 family)
MDMLKRSDANDLTIINFHGIGEPARDLEPGEAPYWLSRDQFCAVLDRIAMDANRHCLSITFDDSNKSDLAIAVPELQARGLTATFFILTGRLGAKGSLHESDVKELFGLGMDIGSHGVAHRDMTRLSPYELDDELGRSKAVLESISRRPVDTVSIPFGRYNARVLKAVRRAGYRAAYSSDGGHTTYRHFLRSRRSIRADMSLDDVGNILTKKATLADRIRRGLWLGIKQLR